MLSDVLMLETALEARSCCMCNISSMQQVCIDMLTASEGVCVSSGHVVEHFNAQLRALLVYCLFVFTVVIWYGSAGMVWLHMRHNKC